MKEKLFHSIMFSLEWRLYAYAITILFLWATTGHLAFAAIQALGLQIFLLIGNTIWYYFRQEGPHAFTLDALATRLGNYFYHSLTHRRGIE
jgi:hypothetical protein